MSVKVELGFTATGASAPFFTLDSATKGLLDSPTWVLGGGEGLVDVTTYAQRVSISRGKSRELDKYSAGRASVAFVNNTRAFDPTYESSPFYGQIVPQRQIKITIDGEVAYVGVVDDWSIDYDAGGMSIATCTAYDAVANLANLTLNDYFPDEEVSGARITGALDNVNWPSAARSIDTGIQTVESTVVSDGTSLINYLQLVADSEPGELFVNKIGEVEFVDRNNSQVVIDVTLSDDGEIPYSSLQVVYGSELLYNRITISNSFEQAVVVNEDSVLLYGERDYSLETLISSESALSEVANFRANEYGTPEYRFEQAVISMDTLTTEQKADILGLELGNIITVKFTPSGIPPQILRAGKVIGIEHDLSPTEHRVALKLATLRAPFLVLDSALFGKLDSNILGL